MNSVFVSSYLCNRPFASAGLISYRCKGKYNWIMIGARDHDDAMVEARRSYANASRDDLQIWNGSEYEAVI